MEKSELEHRKLEVDYNKSLAETEKLRRDLDTYNERFEIEKKKVYSERNRFWAETFRLVAIVIITSATTYLVNNSIEDHKKNNEVIFDDYKSFKTDQQKFNDPLTNLTAKKQLACDMLDEYKDLEFDRVQSFLNKLSAVCGANNMQASQNHIDAGVNNSKVSAALQEQFKIVEQSKNHIDERLKTASGDEKKKLVESNAKTEKTLDSIATLPQVAALSAQTQAVTKTFTDQANVVNNIVKDNSNQKMEDGYPETIWFKENYFLVIDDMKIVLEEIIDNGTIRVSMCRSTTSEVCPIDKQIDLAKYGGQITNDQPLEINENGYKYIIRLDHVGHAGKNPFTKAAYITVEKYSK
jgi:hypothetical protein